MNIFKFLDEQLFNFWLWMGDQFFQVGVVAHDKDGVRGVIFSNDKEFVDSIINNKSDIKKL